MIGDALAGTRIIDFSTLLPGPLATLYLAEAGASVLKIEPPGGEEMRRFPPFLKDGPYKGQGACYRLLNRGKEIREIDLKESGAVTVLRPEIERADILVEQFRPGVMDRLGLGYDAVRAINPGIIYCSITGYGQTGPNAPRAGHDITYMAESGVLGLTVGRGGHPIVPPVLAADIAGGTYPAVMQIALALIKRGRTGEGAHIDISMTDNLLPFAWWAIAIGAATGTVPKAGDWILNGGSPRYAIYPTRDGRAIAVGALEEKFWQSFCDAIGLSDDLRRDREAPDATRAGVASLIAARTAEEWREPLAVADCCCAVVEDLADIFPAELPDSLFR